MRRWSKKDQAGDSGEEFGRQAGSSGSFAGYSEVPQSYLECPGGLCGNRQPEEAAETSNGAPEGAPGREPLGRLSLRQRIAFGLAVAFVFAGLAFLWPILKMAGTGLAAGMVVAVLIFSLMPLLVLRRALRRAGAAPTTRP